MWLVVDTPPEISNDGVIESRLVRADTVTQVKVETIYQMWDDRNGGKVVAIDVVTKSKMIERYRVSVLSNGEWFKLIEFDADRKTDTTPESLVATLYSAINVTTETIIDARNIYDFEGIKRPQLPQVPFIVRD